MNSNSLDATANAASQPGPGTESADETDSNADACCLGDNFTILEFANKQVDVHAHDKSIKPLSNVPIASGTTAWDDPAAGQTHILVVNETLHCGTKLDHSLINPNQIRSFGIDRWDNPFDKSKPMSIRPLDCGATIPLLTVEQRSNLFHEHLHPKNHHIAPTFN